VKWTWTGVALLARHKSEICDSSQERNVVERNWRSLWRTVVSVNDHIASNIDWSCSSSSGTSASRRSVAGPRVQSRSKVFQFFVPLLPGSFFTFHVFRVSTNSSVLFSFRVMKASEKFSSSVVVLFQFFCRRRWSTMTAGWASLSAARRWPRVAQSWRQSTGVLPGWLLLLQLSDCCSRPFHVWKTCRTTPLGTAHSWRSR